MVKRKRIEQIIVPARLTRTQIRRRFVKVNPKKVVVGLRVFPTFRGRKGVAVTFRRRKR